MERNFPEGDTRPAEAERVNEEESSAAVSHGGRVRAQAGLWLGGYSVAVDAFMARISSISRNIRSRTPVRVISG